MQIIEKILKQIMAGEIEEGLDKLEEASKSGNDETKYAIAEAYLELGHIDKAKAIIDELIFLYPDEGGLYVLSAELLIDSEKEDEAIEMLLEVKEEDPAFLQAQLLLADLYQLQGLDEVAEQKLLRARELAPQEPIIAYGLGEFYLERGDYQKSIHLFRQALQAEEELPEVKIELRLAEAYSATGEFEQALIYYQKGLKDTHDLHSLFGYGFTAFQLKDYLLAIEQWNKLKEMDPDFSSVYPYLASAYEAEMLIEEAIETLKDGIKVDEYNEDLYVKLGKLYLKQNNPGEAEENFRKVIALNPSHFEATKNLAALLKYEERYDELIELLEYLKDYGEEDPLLVWFEASAHAYLESFPNAEQCYKEVLDHFQEDPDFLEEYARFLLESGKRPSAKTLFLQALTIDPSRLHIKEIILDLED